MAKGEGFDAAFAKLLWTYVLLQCNIVILKTVASTFAAKCQDAIIT